MSAVGSGIGTSRKNNDDLAWKELSTVLALLGTLQVESAIEDERILRVSEGISKSFFDSSD